VICYLFVLIIYMYIFLILMKVVATLFS